jgi:hypothetical protein
MKMKVFFYAVSCTISCFGNVAATAQPNYQTNAAIKISFVNTVNNVPVILDSGNYANCWNEKFTISALKYYISNVYLVTPEKKAGEEKNSYHLVDEEDSASKNFSFEVPPGSYSTLCFLIGVDSLKNVSGAQTGALDPLNGMFWTWNSGYIMFKMEGNSPQANALKNKIEYHIGGFSGVNNVLRKVELHLDSNMVSINKNGGAEITIQVNWDKLWNGANKLKISDTPLCMTPGAFAAGIADNYSMAFSVVKVVHQ